VSEALHSPEERGPPSHERPADADVRKPPRSGASTGILLIEEYAVVRRGIRLLLDAEPDLEVCGGVSTLAEALDGTWDPAVVVHGLLLPDLTGPEVVARLCQRFPSASLVVLSRVDNPTYVHLAMTAGARGYVLKTSAPGVLIDAVRRVAAGGEYVEPSLGAALARWDGMPRRHHEDALFALTRREQEVLELLALGHTNAEVASSLGVALRTVESHRTHLMQKLGLKTRAELVRYAAERQRSERTNHRRE
jgi:two-component system response regulator NreC